MSTVVKVIVAINRHDEMKKRINEIGARLDMIEKEITPINSKANEVFVDDFVSLEEVRKELSKEIKEVENTTEDSWNSFRNSVTLTGQKLKNLLDRINKKHN